MNNLLRLACTLLLTAALSLRGAVAVLADSTDGKLEPIGHIFRSNLDVEEDGGDDNDDDDTPTPTDDDGFDTPHTDYDGVDTPATDNDGIDTPLSTDDDGVDTPYTDYDGVDEPGVPTLRAEAKGASVKLSWNATAAADSFELWAWDESNAWQKIGGENLNATTYTHTEVVPGTTYSYTIRAISGTGETSGWSSYVTATTAVPGSLTVAPVLTALSGDSQVDLSWNGISGAVRYELWAWENVDGWQPIGGDNLTGTSHQHTGLSAGDSFYYAVRAVDAQGNTGPWSQYADATVGATSGASTSTPTATPTSTPTATPTASTSLSPRSLPGGGQRSNGPTATPTLTSTATTTVTPTATATATVRIQPPDTDNDGYSTPLTDYDGIDTPTTDNDGFSTPPFTDNDGVFTPYTDYDGTDSDGTDSDGIDTPTPTDNDGTDSDGIDTPTPTDNDGTDSDGIDTPSPSSGSDSGASSVSS